MPKVSSISAFAGQTVSPDQADVIAALFAPITRRLAEAITSVILPPATPADRIGPHHTVRGDLICRN